MRKGHHFLGRVPLALSNSFVFPTAVDINDLVEFIPFRCSMLLTGINVNRMEVYVQNQYEDNEREDPRPEGNFSDEAQDSD